MFENKKQLIGLKISIYAIIIALTAMTIAFLIISFKTVKYQAQAKKQIDALYDEVGKLNQDKELLNSTILENQKHLKTLYSSLVEISHNMDIFSNKSADLQSILDETQLKLDLTGKALQSNKDIPVSDGVLDILIVGMHGSLSDTIMLVRILEDQKRVLLISIPRDIYYEGRKINEIYYSYGEEKMREAVMNITGVVVEKYLAVNLDSFVKIFDIVFPEGFEIDVPKAIYDNAYPDSKGGYIVFSVEAGKQNFDAEKTLKYLRTRHADSDFERSARQQDFIAQASMEIKNRGIMANVDSAFSLIKSVNDLMNTDLGVFETMQYMDSYGDYTLSKGNILDNRMKSFSINNEDIEESLFTSTTSSTGQYILIPSTGNFERAWSYVNWLTVTF